MVSISALLKNSMTESERQGSERPFQISREGIWFGGGGIEAEMCVRLERQAHTGVLADTTQLGTIAAKFMMPKCYLVALLWTSLCQSCFR